MKRLLLLCLLLAGSCALPPPTSTVDPSIQDALSRAEKQKPPSAPPLEQQMLPPLRMEMPKIGGEPIDQRFDLSVANAPASQVFNSSGTPSAVILENGRVASEVGVGADAVLAMAGSAGRVLN